MATIEIDFEVFKALTVKRTMESITYNDVIRDLLKLPNKPPVNASANAKGAVLKGVMFPEGTKFRATYKGRTYTAEIKGGVWRDSNGTTRNSPSEAAVKITGKNWNGWRFWYCQRPGETSWTLINDLRPNVDLLAEI